MAYPGGLGEHNARDTLSPQPAAYPYAAAHSSASSIAPPAIGTERNVSAGRCGTVPGGCARPSRVVEALRQRRATAAQAARVPGVATPPMAQWLEPAGADEQPVRPSTVHEACMPPGWGRSVAHRRPDGTTAPEAGAAARERVLLVCLRGGINRVLNAHCARMQKQRLGGVLGTVGGRNGPRDHPRAARHAPRARRRA